MAMVFREVVPAVALVLGSLLTDTSSALVFPRAGKDVVWTCSAVLVSIAIADMPGCGAAAWEWVTALAPCSPSPEGPEALVWLEGIIFPVLSTAEAGSWSEWAGGDCAGGTGGSCEAL